MKYLQQLENHPSIKSKNSDYVRTLISLTEVEIRSLESKYNSGIAFPTALRELLSLAGGYCYVLDYSISDSQEEMQDDARSWLVKYNKSINRPFFTIDVYNGSGQFLFVYLDEGNNPIVYEAMLYDNTTSWIHSLNKTLSDFIDSQMVQLLSGRNPF